MPVLPGWSSQPAHFLAHVDILLRCFQDFLLKAHAVFPDSFVPQDWLRRNSLNQSTKEAKVCPLDIQGSSSAGFSPYFSKNQKLNNFMVAVPKMASHCHVTDSSSPPNKQEVQQDTFPSGLLHQLCQEATFTNTDILESSPSSEDFTDLSGKAKNMNEAEREVNLFALCHTLPLCTVPHFQSSFHRNGKHSVSYCKITS